MNQMIKNSKDKKSKIFNAIQFICNIISQIHFIENLITNNTYENLHLCLKVKNYIMLLPQFFPEWWQ